VNDKRAAPGLPTPEEARREAAAWDYIVNLIDGQQPECDALTGEWMAQVIMGVHAGRLMSRHGLTQDQAVTATKEWVRDRAMLAGAFAASESGGVIEL
jgi:hypothetical protein